MLKNHINREYTRIHSEILCDRSDVVRSMHCLVSITDQRRMVRPHHQDAARPKATQTEDVEPFPFLILSYFTPGPRLAFKLSGFIPKHDAYKP